MKPSLRALLIGSAALAIPQLASAIPPSATLLAGMSAYNNIAGGQASGEVSGDYAKPGLFSASVDKRSASTSTGGDTDGQYGNQTFPESSPAINNGYMALKSLTAETQFIVTSTAITGTSNYTLYQLLFDAAGQTSSLTLKIRYETADADGNTSLTGNLPNQTVNVFPSNGTGIYQSYALNLAGITMGINNPSNNQIRFYFSGGSSLDSLYLDNVALSAFTAVPEPGSLLALGCLVGSGAFLRIRRRRA